MVTRTIISKEIDVTVYNLEKDCKETLHFSNLTIPAIRKLVEDNGKFKMLTVDKTTKIERMYGMEVDTFLRHSVELDPKTRKPIQEDK